MPIRIKIAGTAQELDDVFRLRHQVYVVEEGRFPDASGLSHPGIVDRYDAFPPVANLIAYSDSQPVGTLRLNLDTGQSLPPDELYDFARYRADATADWQRHHGMPPRIGSAGMLAIASGWRHRRDVVLALLKLAAGIGNAWEGTHILATVKAETAPMYHRCGFVELGDPIWAEEIADHVVPIAGRFDDFYRWAYGDLTANEHLLNLFSGSSERILFSAGEEIFARGEAGHQAYLIDGGTVKITLPGSEGEVLTLATLARGQLFGEMSLISDEPRSATAIAMTNTELITLQRSEFTARLERDPHRMRDMLDLLAERLRRMDQMAAIFAFGSDARRIDFALLNAREQAQPDRKREGTVLTRLGPKDIAQSAGVSEAVIRDALDRLQARKCLEYSERWIRFLTQDVIRCD